MWFTHSTLPNDWQTAPIRRIGQVLNGGTPTSDPENWGGDLPFVTPPDLNGADGALIASTSRSLSAKGGIGAGRAPAGSVLVSTRAPIGHVGRVAATSAFNQGCRAVSVRDGVEPRYIAAALVAARAELIARGQGTTFVELSSSVFASTSVPLPPLDEQRAISDYLDRETAQIDALVAKQEELVGLLRERRGAIRSALAVRGTLEKSKLSGTRLPWAPLIPSAWRVVPLTSVARLESGHTPSRTRSEWWEDVHIPWISLNDVSAMSSGEYIGSTVNLISDAGLANSSARLLPAGTVVLSRDATIGRSAILEIPMATSQHFANWVCRDELNPRYLWLLFTSAMQQYFDSLTDGSTIKTIGMGDLRAIKIPLPPLDEQARIVAFAEKSASRIDALIAKAEEHIALAKERRSALITAAVTGQIEVRTERKAS